MEGNWGIVVCWKVAPGICPAPMICPDGPGGRKWKGGKGGIIK